MGDTAAVVNALAAVVIGLDRVFDAEARIVGERGIIKECLFMYGKIIACEFMRAARTPDTIIHKKIHKEPSVKDEWLLLERVLQIAERSVTLRAQLKQAGQLAFLRQVHPAFSGPQAVFGAEEIAVIDNGSEDQIKECVTKMHKTVVSVLSEMRDV